MAAKQTILLFHVSTEKEQKIREMCKTLGIEVQIVDKKDYAKKLGYLAGIAGFKKENTMYQGSELPAEMLVFSGMDSDQVDIFLKTYRESQLAPIGCKAILTPDNVFWTADQLFRELLQEHMFFSKR